MPNVAFLEAFAEAWNRHDIDAIMAAMTEDCVFVTSNGSRYDGQEAVREVFEDVIASYTGLTFKNARHAVDGKRGISEWIFSGVDVEDGEVMEIDGCDVFTFRDGLIALKNTYMKQS